MVKHRKILFALAAIASFGASTGFAHDVCVEHVDAGTSETHTLRMSRFHLPPDILFDFNKADLKPKGRDELDEIVNRIKIQGVTLELLVVVGHTDRIGGDVPNQRLSERRAASAKSYLITQGIDASLIHAEGRGSTQPVTGSTCNDIRDRQALIDCLLPDRRVDIEVTGTIQN